MSNKDFELGQQIAELRGMTAKGFEAITQRLDTSNGRLAKHDEIINRLSSGDSFEKGEHKGISKTWYLLFGLASLVVAIITIFYKR